ncbi:hypothetical protein [Streptomyces flavofungini]|uniref:hypothetical protein n=1 Tax=Streptomyces flavofungini TaxID=68200 RepID=UPI0025B1C03C|nr:hypothetical protein [Streptomyces flavofungini]WJV45224.1 hypothetical protein QUY26_06505 [Streptomyces flavofungini]
MSACDPAAAAPWTPAARARLALAYEAYELAELACGDVSDPALREPDGWRSYLLREPLEAAQDLDDWVLRHQDGDGDLEDAPVSGPLLRPAPDGRP